MKKGWYIFTILSLFLLIAGRTKATGVKMFHLQLPSSSCVGVISNDSVKKPKLLPVNISPRPSAMPGTCNVADVRAKLIAAGCIELLEMNSSCSLYFLNTNDLTGSEAQAFAQTLGANLISVQSKAENDSLGKALVKQGFGGVIWIGFSDAKKEGDFVWFDGSNISYTNWATGEPNNNNPGDPDGEDCTQIYADGSWNDLSCGLKSHSVIEVNLCPTTAIVPSKPTTICLGDTITLSAKTLLGAPDYHYKWSSTPAGVTDTTEDIKVSPLTTTTYTVNMIDRYKCSSSQTITVTVNAVKATITPSGPTTFCDGDSLVLTASAGLAYKWSTLETTQSITVKKSGTYIVAVTDPPCVKLADIVVTVNPKPIAKFKNTTVCKGTGTQFSDLSTGATFWGWDFGDGSQGIGQNPNHTYAKAGVYKVTLAAVGAGNCTDTIQQLVTVNDVPAVSFYSYNTCTKDSIYFSNTTTIDSSATIVSYLYDFGDGKTGNRPDMAHLYAKGGNYKVTLTVTSSEGCKGVAIVNTPIFDSPKAIATGIENHCSNDSSQFINNSTVTGGKIAKFYWVFGDGTVDSTTRDPKHLYTAGTYTVMLVLVSDGGCTDTLQKEIEIYPDVVANFTAPDVCLHQPTNFTNSSTGPVITYAWDLNDNSFESLSDPSHIYLIPKIYSVKLTVTSARGCKSTITKKVSVHELPTAKFTAPNTCDGKKVIFTNKSIITGNSSITKWLWDFDDGTTDTAASPTHLYTTIKQYNIKFKVVSNFGCADSTTKVVTINPNPIPDFTSADTAGCSPLTALFRNTTTISAGQIVKWLWEFGSINSKSDLKDPPPHIFKNTSNTTPVKFNMKLTATSDSGCVASIIKPGFITVWPTPKAAFNFDPPSALVTNPVISFTNLSVGADSCKWAFADLGTSDLCDPGTYTFVDTGSFVVSLITTNSFGCADTTAKTVIIEPDYVLYIPNSFTPNADDVNEVFVAKGSFIMDYEMTIYDRWGSVIYETKDINLPWNGGYKNATKLMPADLYVYVIKVKATNKKNYYYRGVVSLLR
ncbi:MAG TPA: PKD domain-containing protein [Bacteroidia bacterium]|jgi:gliding motility-associated-like protein|nr:PKD domain-containing protein [Bacteroidia bacterium]